MQVISVRIDRLDEDGRGVGNTATCELHVAGALPGETVRAEIAHTSPHAARAWANNFEIIGEPAQERVPPACPGHGTCGGCALQHLAYPVQLSYKRGAIEAALATHPNLAGLAVEDVVASPHELQYRNKAKYVIAGGPDGGLRLGSYAPASHRVIDMAGCQVPEEPIDRVARRLVEQLEAAQLSAYDEARHTGELRHLVLRTNADGQLLVVIVAATSGAQAALVPVARALRAEIPAVIGVVLNVNAGRGGAIFGPTDVPLDGVARLSDRVGDIVLELSARAFFQINRAQAARIYAEVTRAIGPIRSGLRIVDLYCGVGGIALTLAHRGAQVVGVEVVADAVADARRSAARNRLPVEFFAADAVDGLARATAQLGGLEALVVNPPRKGLGTDARAAILTLAPPRVVYVSCNPRSLANDLAAFVAAGYHVQAIRPFDLMPGTAHVETLTIIER